MNSFRISLKVALIATVMMGSLFPSLSASACPLRALKSSSVPAPRSSDRPTPTSTSTLKTPENRDVWTIVAASLITTGAVATASMYRSKLLQKRAIAQPMSLDHPELLYPEFLLEPLPKEALPQVELLPELESQVERFLVSTR